MKIFIYSTCPFSLQPPFLPTQPLFNQSQFFWKGKIKHTGADITCSFQDAKSSLRKHKKCFLEAFYGTSQTSKMQLFMKKVNGLQPKTISAKNSPQMFESLLKNTNSYFVNPTQNIKTSTKSKDFMQNTSPLFNNSPTLPYN